MGDPLGSGLSVHQQLCQQESVGKLSDGEQRTDKELSGDKGSVGCIQGACYQS